MLHTVLPAMHNSIRKRERFRGHPSTAVSSRLVHEDMQAWRVGGQQRQAAMPRRFQVNRWLPIRHAHAASNAQHREQKTSGDPSTAVSSLHATMHCGASLGSNAKLPCLCRVQVNTWLLTEHRSTRQQCTQAEVAQCMSDQSGCCTE
jgi:hypothetical protein